MCHGYEFEMLKRAYAEELARRNREKAEAQKKESATTAPPKPTAPAPRIRDKEPVPA